MDLTTHMIAAGSQVIQDQCDIIPEQVYHVMLDKRYDTIDDALTASNTGDTVVVASDGVYLSRERQEHG